MGAHAVITSNRLGDYTVSVRAPVANPQGADTLCLKFETGGGRPPPPASTASPQMRLTNSSQCSLNSFPRRCWSPYCPGMPLLNERNAMVSHSKHHPRAPQSDGDSQVRLVTALLDPGVLSPSGETRAADRNAYFLGTAGRRYAYKIKKSVALRLPELYQPRTAPRLLQRRNRLNRRLAPQLYLDVVPIGGTPQIPVFGEKPAIEYAIRMKRFPTSRQFDRLVARRRLLPHISIAWLSHCPILYSDYPRRRPQGNLVQPLPRMQQYPKV